MKSRNNKENLDILTVISFKHLRTVESFDMKKAEKEYPVEFVLKENFQKSLNFKTPWDGHIFAYSFLNDSMTSLLSKHNFDKTKIKMFITDWDSRFVLSIEQPDIELEVQFYVSSLDVKYLLENCLRIPEQREKND